MIKLKREKKEDNFLLYIPKKKHSNWQIDKGRVKLIFYHDKPAEKFIRALMKKSRNSDVTFDDIGSTTWNLINGQNTVYDIGKELLKIYGEACEPVYDRLIMYIRYLNRRNWISFERGKQ